MRKAVTCRWSYTVWHISRNVCVVTQGLPQVSHEFARGAMPHVNSAIRIIEGPAMVFMIGLDVYIATNGGAAGVSMRAHLINEFGRQRRARQIEKIRIVPQPNGGQRLRRRRFF